MEMYMKVNGRMIKPMVEGSILTQMDPGTRESGVKINRMDMVLKDGLMVLVMKGNMSKGKNMVKGNSFGQMVVHLVVTFMIITLKGGVSTNGPMVEYLMVNGKTIKCRAMEHLPGLMVGNMLANITMI